MKIVRGSLRRMTTPEGQEITFTTKDVNEADKLFASWAMKDQKPDLTVEIKQIRKKRSLNANNYMWKLCDEISSVLRTPREEVYRKAVKEVGIFSDVQIQKHALKTFVSQWDGHGVGWFTEATESRVEGFKWVRCYYGSSTYDSKQMSRLIDYIVDEAKNLDIETLTPDELSRIEAAWR